MEERKKVYLENGNTYTFPTDENEIKKSLKKFNDVCNEIFSDKKKYKELFYTDEEIEELKNNPQKCKELNITFI